MWNTNMKWAGVVVITAIIIIGIYDFSVVYLTGNMSSISTFFYNIGIRSPLFVFGVGVCVGHFWLAVYPTGYDPRKPD